MHLEFDPGVGLNIYAHGLTVVRLAADVFPDQSQVRVFAGIGVADFTTHIISRNCRDHRKPLLTAISPESVRLYSQTAPVSIRISPDNSGQLNSL